MTKGAYSSHKNKNASITKQLSYEIITKIVSPGVEIKGDFLGQLNNLKYADHDVRDIAKFPDFSKQNYMDLKPQLGGIVLYEEYNWALGLKESTILNFLDITHFGRNLKVNAYVKKLLSCIHGGTLWLDEKVEITLQLIS